MAFADHDHMVEELSANTADKPFSHCIRSRGSGRGADSRYAQPPELPIEVIAIAGVSVMDQVRRLAAPWSRLQDLAPDPSGCGVGGHVEMDQFTALVPHEEEDLQSPEANGLDHQQVSGPDALQFVA